MIQARGVTFAFPGHTVLSELSLDVEDSLATVVVGRSGIGKSVLLKCITGLLKPASGTIRIDGDEVVGADRRKLLEIRGRVGMLFQEGALFDSMDVYDNVAFPLVYHKSCSAAEVERRVTSYLELVGMLDSKRAMPRELSGGMKRKVAVARAMILEPRYLLYDEPTAGLDPASAAIVETLIHQLQVARSITSLIVTHDIDLTRFLADRIALLEDGRIVSCETREEAFREGSPVYEHFIERRERIRQGNGL
ncbi:MAG TPA: ATP-binding cassette domain-containing protein [Spirochaetia bacterium]|nr:ATP-binding cassette domain-containing protein [Spirochaetia bacterium]